MKDIRENKNTYIPYEEDDDSERLTASDIIKKIFVNSFAIVLGIGLSVAILFAAFMYMYFFLCAYSTQDFKTICLSAFGIVGLLVGTIALIVHEVKKIKRVRHGGKRHYERTNQQYGHKRMQGAPQKQRQNTYRTLK